MHACNTDIPFCANLNMKARTVTSYVFRCQLFIKSNLEIISHVNPSHMHTSFTKLTIMLTLETIEKCFHTQTSHCLHNNITESFKRVMKVFTKLFNILTFQGYSQLSVPTKLFH